MDKIVLRGLRAFGYHGVFDFEQREGQEFEVDLVLHAPLARAAETDDVADTIHYGDLAESVAGIIRDERYNLIEALAQRIADAALGMGAAAVDVTVHKPHAPIREEFADVAVQIHRTNPLDEVPAEPVPFVIALGANEGDPRAQVAQAAEWLGAQHDKVKVSSLVESDAHVLPGSDPQSVYVNAVVTGETSLSPRELLHALQTYEADAGRERTERWGPRPIDLDIVTYGELSSGDPVLTLPHPRAGERLFVLAPWLELDPDAELAGKRVDALIAALPESERAGTRPLGPVG